MAKKIELKGEKEIISFSTLMEKTKDEIEILELQLQSADCLGDIACVRKRIVSQKFSVNEKVFPKSINRSSLPHLKNIDILEGQIPKVSILIGKDVDYVQEVFEVRKSSSAANRLNAIRGPVGWIITGTNHNSTHKELNVNLT